MNLKITKEIDLTANEIKDIIVKYLHLNYNLDGIFDIDFNLGKNFYPSQYPQDSHFTYELVGAKVRISENE